MTTDAMEALCRHALATRFEDLPDAALACARVFLLDSLGVGIAGSRGPFVEALLAAHAGVPEARVLGRAQALPAPGAALVNACQIHNSEFDCVHEAAVVHPMAVLLGAVLAWLDRHHAGSGAPVSGRELLAALVLGVDVACHLGVAARSALRFFRPGTAGAFAATAALGRLQGFDPPTLGHAAGITLGQLCGTMQAHSEGSPLLAMQVGFNARNAVTSCDLAARGVPGPRHVLEGPFGYFTLFEAEVAVAPMLAQLGRVWRITEVAHKPFPSGRATHGIVDACLALAGRHGIEAAQVAAVHAHVPPLTRRLVGRPVVAHMEVNYARLCAPYVAARALMGCALGLEDFAPAALADEATLALARRIQVHAVEHPDPNALTPVRVEIVLGDGRRLGHEVDVVYGNPRRPMTRDAQLEKFRRNWHASAEALDAGAAQRVVRIVDALEALGDVRELTEAVHQFA